MGTVAYMSPEQAEGKPVDRRSDIFSLGVLLYEMATGERPFKGDTSVSVAGGDHPGHAQPVTELNPALPRDLTRVIRRCLSKDPDHRYQTRKDVRNELEDLKRDRVRRAASGAAPERQSAPRRRRPVRMATAAAWPRVAAAGLAVVWGRPGACRRRQPHRS